MAYRWEPSPGPFTPAELGSAGLAPVFESQAAAEEWLGLFYEDLREMGVSEVSLFEEDRLVYGPMPLSE